MYRLVLLVLLIPGLFAQDTAEKSVKPGINDSWKSEKIEPLVDRLESESREIFTQRGELLKSINVKKGMTVADIGAGSGFMALLFAKATGKDGKVYAVDINAKLMEKVAADAAAEGLKNVETVVCDDKSVNLPANSVDLIFLCDTYHHFEYPASVMKSIYTALKPGGEVIVVDFIREEGVSSDWILNHVRAGLEEVKQEIIACDFRFERRHAAPYLKENYILRFKRLEKM